MTFAYLRVSTEKQHLDNQKEEIIKFCQTNSLSIDRWFYETVSGTKDYENREFFQIMSSVKAGDVIVVSEISRISRKMFEITAVFHQCVRKQVSLYSVKEGYKFCDDLNSKIMGFAFGLTAELERNLISLRTKEALALRRQQGIRLGRPPGSHKIKISSRQFSSDLARRLQNNEPKSEIAKEYGISRVTLYSYIQKLQLDKYEPC